MIAFLQKLNLQQLGCDVEAFSVLIHGLVLSKGDSGCNLQKADAMASSDLSTATFGKEFL
jgi:hypothetical protein